MAMVISRNNMLNANIKNVFTYLDRQYRNYGWDETEEDIKMGFTDLRTELFNATKALLVLKEQNKNNQKICTAINSYLKILAKESSNIKVN